MDGPWVRKQIIREKLFRGKCPENGHSLESLREAHASLRVAVTYSFAENLSHFLPVQLQFHPWERGTLVTKCPLGFSSADPSVDRFGREQHGFGGQLLWPQEA